MAGTSIPGWGAEGNPPTVITSDVMTASSEKNQAIFKGSVKLVQGELIVYSDVMIVYFQEKASPSSSTGSDEKSGKEIQRIEARGHVKILKGESRATSEHAVYYKQDEKVILRGSPIAWQEGTKITGPKMTMYLKENRSIVEGGTRVVIEESETR
ncbi:MAG: LptA/OstA family protein [Nitrospirales bacterium]|nr:LptA/OstA family protein [Nitrospirales bacterium]